MFLVHVANTFLEPIINYRSTVAASQFQYSILAANKLQYLRWPQYFKMQFSFYSWTLLHLTSELLVRKCYLDIRNEKNYFYSLNIGHESYKKCVFFLAMLTPSNGMHACCRGLFILLSCTLGVVICCWVLLFWVLYSIAVCTCTLSCNRLCRWLSCVRIYYHLLCNLWFLLLYRIFLCTWVCVIM